MTKYGVFCSTLLILFFFFGTHLHLSAQVEPKPIINASLHGTVIDASTKQPIEGATVQLQAVTHSVKTDPDGHFEFVTGQKLPFTLIVSFVGYETNTVIIQDSPAEIALTPSSNELDEVVVVGYGTQRRSDLVSSVSKINPEQTKGIPEASFDAQLQGKASGVQINTNTGVPGSDVFIRVRGATSINAGNDPLYVIDGVFVNNESLQSIAQDRKTSPLSDINPNDIQSIEILKDATAIGIYGSRGANGVVLVTTKRGGYGERARINLNISNGFSKAISSRIWETTTGEEHALLINEFNRNMGRSEPFRPVAEGGRGLPAEQNTYDRLQYLFRTASLQNYDLSIQGGSDRTRYYVGGGYTQQESIWKPMGFDRYSFKINLDQKLREQVTIGFSNSFSKSHRDQARPANGGNGTLLQASLNIPTYLPVFDEKGTPLKWVNFDNIYTLTNNQNLWSDSYHYIGNGFLDVSISPKLKFRSTLGVDFNQYNEGEWWDSSTILGVNRGLASQSNTQSLSIVNEQTISYSDKFGDHTVGGMLGNTVQSTKLTNVFASGSNFPNNSYTQISSASNQTAGQSERESTLASFFTRLNYNYQNRYYAEFIFRADGSSKFGSSNRWGYFPAAGLAWNLTKESFLADQHTLSNLKLRLNYGKTGNQSGIDEYATYGLWKGGDGYADIPGGEEKPGTAPLQLRNDDLKWESTTQLNLGLDVGFWKDRLTFELNYYQKDTRDALLLVGTPGSTGYQSYMTNYGRISNKGFELTINSNLVAKENFSWQADLNMSRNKNQVKDIPADIPFAGRDLIRLQQGFPLYSYWLYNQIGVDPQTGDVQFEDINKDGQITVADRTIVGDTWPKLFGGFTNNLRYKSLDASILFSFSIGNKTWNHNKMLGETGGTLDANRVLLKSQLDRWTTPGQITDVPRLSTANYSIQENSRYLEDASYLRLRNISLGYTFNKSWTERVKLKNLRLYVSASNLFLITPYSGADPEANLGTENIQGYDYGTPPQPRTFQFGIQASL